MPRFPALASAVGSTRCTPAPALVAAMEFYATASRRERAVDSTPMEILCVHFADETAAEVFARAFGLRCPLAAP